ncbi:MAG: hypothetical protein NZ108_09395, partial [Bacteroidia bacterium]|nr:hypothetical protein [Bacteroidia bacterium]
MNLFQKIRLAFLLALIWGNCSYAQQWFYETVTTDLQEGGLYPSMVQDSQGNLHATWWNQFQDKLMYGFKHRDSLNWYIEPVDPNKKNGIRSKIKISPSGVVSAAWFENINGKLFLRFGIRNPSTNTWEIEYPNDEQWGNYSEVQTA